MTLAASILAGDRLSLARLLTQVENDSPDGRAALVELFPHTGQAHLIGVTGAPGTGKSSLVNQLALHYRKQADKRVAVVAVDPSSPFTGGAVLGDRVRMRDLSGDPNVFIRSMASRGSLGGLAQATAGMVQVFDAAGFDVILIETVGAGQSEVDIARLAHTTLVVEAPGLGDDIQAIKAGILEIADILVINKADRPGVENTERALRNMLEYGHPVRRMENGFHHADVGLQAAAENAEFWLPPVLKTIATQEVGIAEVVEAIERHAAHLQNTGELEERRQLRLRNEVQHLLLDELLERWSEDGGTGRLEEILQSVYDRRISPRQAAQNLAAETPAQ